MKIGKMCRTGRFEFKLPYGGKYRISIESPSLKFVIAEHLESKAGEEIDLGDVVVSSKK